MESRFHKVKAILYLHLLRTWRYRYSFINSTINMGLWVAIYILGALLFVPHEKIGVMAPYMFWGILLWSIMTSSVWSIGSWTWFLLSLGLYEEHVLHDTSLPAFLSGRTVTVAMDTILITPIMYFLVRKLAPGTHVVAGNILFIASGIIAMYLISISYALILSAISLRIGVPGTLLDMSNFLLLVVGGIAVPLEALPGALRKLALLIPFSYPAEITRFGATGLEPILGVEKTSLITLMLSVGMVFASLWVFRWVENRYIRIYGPRAIGRM